MRAASTRSTNLPRGCNQVADQSRTTDVDFEAMLDEIQDLVSYLRKNHRAARARAKMPVRDGYPTRSMPDSSIAAGRFGDPTGDFVTSLAGGKVDDEGMAVDDDSWRGPHDPIGALVRNMNREVEDARNRLRGAGGALRSALPPSNLPDPAREQCVSCGTSKDVATEHGRKPRGWVASEARCESCSRRVKRHAAVSPGTGVAGS